MGLQKDFDENQSLSEYNFDEENEAINEIEDIEEEHETLDHKKKVKRLLEERLERKRLKEELEDEFESEFDWDEPD